MYYIVFVSIAGEKPLDTYLSEKYPGVTLSEDAMDKIKKTKASDTYFCFTPKTNGLLISKQALFLFVYSYHMIGKILPIF